MRPAAQCSKRPPRLPSWCAPPPLELGELVGTSLRSAPRRGKFLLMTFARDGVDARILAANPMLAGRFWLLEHGRDKVRARTGLRLRFADGGELRYVDREMLGKLYLVPPRRARCHPRLDGDGPRCGRSGPHPGALPRADPPPPRGAEVAAAQQPLRGRHRQRLQRRDPVGSPPGATSQTGARCVPRTSTGSTPPCAPSSPMPRSGCARWCRPTSISSTASSSRCTCAAASRARAADGRCGRSAATRRRPSAGDASRRPDRAGAPSGDDQDLPDD